MIINLEVAYFICHFFTKLYEKVGKIYNLGP